jgi:hypothetical protein
LLLEEESRLCEGATTEVLRARDLQSRWGTAHEKQVSVAVVKAALVRKGFVGKRTRTRLKEKRDEVAFRKAWAEIREMIKKARASPKDDDDRNGGGWGGEDGEEPSQETDGNPPRVIAYVDEADFCNPIRQRGFAGVLTVLRPPHFQFRYPCRELHNLRQ